MGLTQGPCSGTQQDKTCLCGCLCLQVMAGQGSVAVEILHQLPQGVDAIIVPGGGGGLIGGIAAVMKAWRPEVQVSLQAAA